MYNWENGPPSPPLQLLSQCQQILLTDEDIEKRHHSTPFAIKKWAQENCKSFVFMHEQDVSDASLYWDYIYAFYFHEEKDANWFQLKWK